MQLPRPLFRTADGGICEYDDPAQVMMIGMAGGYVPDYEAEQMGLISYLNETGWGDKPHEKGHRRVTEAQYEKALAQAETENKAVTEDEAEDKPAPGMHFPPEARRGPGRPRGS